MGGNGRALYFPRLICTARLMPRQTNKIRISRCSVTGNRVVSVSYYRGENSPLHPNKIKHFPLYFGERA